MTGGIDFATTELATSVARLAEDLVFLPQVVGGERYYHLESTKRSDYFRVGYREYIFISLLDGKNTFAQALSQSVRLLGADALKREEAEETYTWLLRSGLAQLVGGHQSNQHQQQAVPLWKQLNPFSMKLPLPGAETFFTHAARYLQWIFSVPAMVVGLAMIGIAFMVVMTSWEAFGFSARTILDPRQWLYLSTAWCVLKVVHELGHGVACKRCRAEVKGMGLVFILFAPMAYVDVTPAWRLPSKWQRVGIAAAGMYLELLVASLAVFLWFTTDNAVAANLLHSVILLASVNTLMFNLNPLMRFDGYFILSDLIGSTNLFERATRHFQQFCQRVFYGTSVKGEQLAKSFRVLLTCYGASIFCWRWVVAVSLLVSASLLLEGLGIVLAVIGFILWTVWPIARGLFHWWRHYLENPPSAVRAAVISSIGVLVISAVVFWIPWPSRIVEPAIIDYADLSLVRCQSEGFVRKIHVKDGQFVEAGEVLLELENRDLVVEAATLRSKIEQLSADYRRATGNHEATESQVVQRKCEALQERLNEVQRKLAHLLIRAPAAGNVVRHRLTDWQDVYVKEGDELLALGDAKFMEVTVSIGHAHADLLPKLKEQTVFIRLASGSSLRGTIDRINPRASLSLPHPALGATNGGVLPVTPAPSGREDQRWQLLEPRFTAVIKVPSETYELLAAGQRGYAKLGWEPRSLAARTWVELRKWIDQQREAQQAAALPLLRTARPLQAM